ncbi:MAG: sigma-70 family RNA polymerase sigma factor [Christensenellaceae bacterium]|nr:sigma-70 family RNA polymerase sigma factor [Christensenellaceae bacterium]
MEQLELEKYSPLVKSIVKRYIGKGVEYDDLYQLGCLGLVKAHNKFDTSYGVKFTTYAVPLIAGEIKRFLRDDGQIKVSRSVKGLYSKIKKFLAAHQNDEVQPTVDELAVEFGVTREEVIYAMEASHLPISLFDNGDGEGLTLAERLAGDDHTNLVDNIVIHNMLKELDTREKKIILLRYFRNITQSEVAKRLNISQVQVSRIEQRVLERFRTALDETSADAIS